MKDPPAAVLLSEQWKVSDPEGKANTALLLSPGFLKLWPWALAPVFNTNIQLNFPKGSSNWGPKQEFPTETVRSKDSEAQEGQTESCSSKGDQVEKDLPSPPPPPQGASDLS